MAKNIIDESKKWLGYFYDGQEWIEEPKVIFNGKRVENKDTIEFLKNLFKFMIDSNCLNAESKLWLRSNMGSVRETFEFYNRQVGEVGKININTAQSKVNYDKKRLSSIFDSEDIVNVILYPERCLSELKFKLNKLRREYMDSSIYSDKLLIKIPKQFMCECLDEVRWVQLTNLLSTYSKNRVKKIEDSTDINLFGYYNYLISKEDLNEEESERLKEIKSILGIQYTQ